MTRAQWVFVSLLTIELAAAAVLLSRRATQASVPVPDAKGIDTITLGELRQIAEGCNVRDPNELLQLARYYVAQGFPAEAEACCRLAAEIRPDAEVLFERGFCFSQMGRAREAITCFGEAIDAGHRQPNQCWYFIGRNQLRREDADAARAAFERASSLPAARWELAKLDIKLGRPAEAIPRLKELDRQFPKARSVYLLLARAYSMTGDAQSAADYADRWDHASADLMTPVLGVYQRVFRRRDESMYFKQWDECYQLVDQGRAMDAKKRLDELLAAQWSAELTDLQAEIARQQNQKEEAESRLRSIIEHDGPSMHVWWRLGDLYSRSGRGEEAVEAWHKAELLGRGNHELHDLCRTIAAHYQSAGNEEQAQRYQALSLQIAGQVAYWQEDYSRARIALEQAVTQNSEHADSWYYLAQTRRQLGETAAAREAYARCLELAPDHGRALRGAALLPP